MRQLEEIAQLHLSLPPSSSDFLSKEAKLDPILPNWWLYNCHGWLYNVSLIVSSLLFLVYLALQAKKSFTKLFHGRSYIMIAYYGLVWLVSVLNLAWCFSQTWECSPGKEFSWNLLSLFTTSGMLFLEISLLAFLLQGSYTSGLQALSRTFIISGIILSVDILLKAIYVFGFGVPLFIDLNNGSRNKIKWGLWVVHKLLLTGVYGFILFMHHTKYRERLPARPAFYNYISLMLCLNAIALFACLLVASGAGLGFWLYDFTKICYHAFYLPLIYVTFLSDFFQEDDLHLENVYYSEMKDAGFFDDGWE